uniref:BACK domain-containing protein n=1 Tax=Macrostomum lignano TaxID=282301 RepID=A0A1I8JNQ9_9PLAT
KLNRRQKAYDSIRSELDPATRTKIESAVLNRDYTSSDEKDTSTAGDGVDQQTADEQSQPLRVRELIWESEELRQLKNRLTPWQQPLLRLFVDNLACTLIDQRLFTTVLDWARKPAAAADTILLLELVVAAIPGSVVEMHKNRINVGELRTHAAACYLEFRSMQSFCPAQSSSFGRKGNVKKRNSVAAKAFEALLPSLTPDELEQIRVVLTRDVTFNRRRRRRRDSEKFFY